MSMFWITRVRRIDRTRVSWSQGLHIWGLELLLWGSLWLRPQRAYNKGFSVLHRYFSSQKFCIYVNRTTLNADTIKHAFLCLFMLAVNAGSLVGNAGMTGNRLCLRFCFKASWLAADMFLSNSIYVPRCISFHIKPWLIQIGSLLP